MSNVQVASYAAGGEVESGAPQLQTAVGCPICNSDRTSFVRQYSSELAAEYFAPLQRDAARHRDLVRNIEDLWGGSTTEIRRCEGCHFTFPFPYVAGDKRFYELTMELPHYPRNRWEYDRAVEFMTEQKASSSSLKMLELGAGVGSFVKKIQSEPKFRSWQVSATDYSPYSIAQLRKLGIEARLADVFELAELESNRGSFDIICGFQCIEHMADVVSVFAALHKLVKPGGFVIVSVPNSSRIEFNERYLDYFDMPPNHVGVWYRTSFEALAARTNFKLITHELEPIKLVPTLSYLAYFNFNGSASEQRTMAQRVQSVRNRTSRMVLKALVGSLMALKALPLLRKIDSGPAQFAVLQRLEE